MVGKERGSVAYGQCPSRGDVESENVACDDRPALTASYVPESFNSFEAFVLRVSAEHVREAIKNIQKEASIFLHLGVDVSCQKPVFALESMAYNTASFRIKDEDGYQPQDIAIHGSKPLHEPLCCTIDLNRAASKLIEAGHGVVVSNDPGRFVCNYTYYTSLVECAERNDGSCAIFVHVPSFSVIPEDQQRKFLLDLIYFLGNL